jgi:DoxX-like family
MPKLGAGLTGLVVLFLASTALAKSFAWLRWWGRCQKAGIDSELVTGIGLLLLACTAIYIIPKTAILGAILLTGYLGGAVAVPVISRAGNSAIFLRSALASLDRIGSARTSVGPVSSLATILAGARNNQESPKESHDKLLKQLATGCRLWVVFAVVRPAVHEWQSDMLG